MEGVSFDSVESVESVASALCTIVIRFKAVRFQISDQTIDHLTDFTALLIR
jgi:hypothetical protein